MKLAWYRITCKPNAEPNRVEEWQGMASLPESSFVREYRERPDAPDQGAITLREYWIQAFDAFDALERWRRAGQ